MNKRLVLKALVEMFDRIYKSPPNAALGLRPVEKEDLERWALAIAEASPDDYDVEPGVPLKDLPKWKSRARARK